MPYRAFEGQNCSIARTLAVVGERWTLLVMRDVLNGHRRFRELRRTTGIAANILSDRLGTLVEHGLLRHDETTGEYRPTRKGADLSPVLIALMSWGDRYAAPRGAPRVVVHTACGHDAQPRLHCAHCDAPLEPSDVALRDGPGAAA
jgi:DNA-binding HxlR family transcriptional regulator